MVVLARSQVDDMAKIHGGKSGESAAKRMGIDVKTFLPNVQSEPSSSSGELSYNAFVNTLQTSTQSNQLGEGDGNARILSAKYDNSGE